MTREEHSNINTIENTKPKTKRKGETGIRETVFFSPANDRKGGLGPHFFDFIFY